MISNLLDPFDPQQLTGPQNHELNFVTTAERSLSVPRTPIPTTNCRSVYVSTWPHQAAPPPRTSAHAKIHQLLSAAGRSAMRNQFVLGQERTVRHVPQASGEITYSLKDIIIIRRQHTASRPANDKTKQTGERSFARCLVNYCSYKSD